MQSLTGGKITGDENIKIYKSCKKLKMPTLVNLHFYIFPLMKNILPYQSFRNLVKPGFNKIRRDIAYIEVNDPNKAFSKILIHYSTPEFSLTGIDISASVHLCLFW